jgi:hypothetical protein
MRARDKMQLIDSFQDFEFFVLRPTAGAATGHLAFHTRSDCRVLAYVIASWVSGYVIPVHRAKASYVICLLGVRARA